MAVAEASTVELKNKKWDLDYFYNKRTEILSKWPTGAEVDLEEAIRYQKLVPESKNAGRVLAEAKKHGRILMQPRAGVASLDRMIELLVGLEDHGADILPVTVDGYTRNGQYLEAGNGIEESEKAGRSMLNGFPVVNHGVQGCRRLLEAGHRPLRLRAASPVPGLAQEIGLASGFTGTSLGGVTFAIGYNKDLPLEESIRNWQYVARLIGIYEEAGILIKGGIYLPLSTVVPPCLNHATSIIDALLSVEQGVRHVCIGYPQQGHLIQDVAAVRALEELTEEYLKKLGYHGVVVTTAFHQWMGSFPADQASAFAVISAGAFAAAIARPTQVMVKTPDEAIGIPTQESNVMGMACTRQILNLFANQTIDLGPALREEKEVICQEVRAILDRTLHLGDGDIAKGVTAGFAAGVIDVPFSPNVNNRDKVMAVRDAEGAVRFFDTGNLPFPKELKLFHKAKMEKRRKAEETLSPYQMLIDDVRAIAHGGAIGTRLPPRELRR